MGLKYIIGGVIILGFLIWGGSSFLKSSVRYVPIAEAASSERTVQVMGKIDFDQVRYDVDSSHLEFAIYDAEADGPDGADQLQVVYSGAVPGNFEQATSVVVKGHANADGVFEANQMLVKCPSKYQGAGGEYQDPSKHKGPAATVTGS